jgi:hypothetical protein
MRIRTIKPEFWKHEELSALPEATHMLAAALLNYSDDEGYFNANPRLIQSECCPLREPSVSVQDSLTSLSVMGYIRLGKTIEGKHYGQVINFLEHQRVNRPVASKIKELAILWADSPTPHTQITEPSPPEGKGMEEEGNGERASERAPTPKIDKRGTRIPDDWQPPSVGKAYGLGRGIPDSLLADEIEAFRDHWRAKPGKDGLKLDWDAAWRTWVKRSCKWQNYSPPSPMAKDGATVWMPNHDGRFPPLRDRWTREHGKPPPEMGSRGNPGVGWHFPAAWLSEIPTSLKRSEEAA